MKNKLESILAVAGFAPTNDINIHAFKIVRSIWKR